MTSEVWFQILVWLGVIAVVTLLISKLVKWYSRKVVDGILKEEKMFYDQTKINVQTPTKMKQIPTPKKTNPWFKPSRS